MARASLPEHVRALLRGSAYPGKARRVDLVQTHISWVFLVGDDVYKLKKPVDLGFADFTTLEKRRAACEAEVKLNRRGCPGDVYKGVEPITSQGGSFRVGGNGEIVDYAVHMRRLSLDGMMDRLLERDEVDFDMIGRVAGRLAELHRAAERNDRITRLGGRKTLYENWIQTLDQARPFAGRTVSRKRLERIEAFAVGFMQREAALLARRDREGWIRDCHGDLRSDSIVFDPRVPGGICIYDCIEFNDRFRYVDTGLDAAFLAMDLDYRGNAELSDLFMGLYAAAIGDKELPVLLRFYKCYRAMVRGKVESLLLDDPGVSRRQKAEARKRARAYFGLAESYSRGSATRALLMVSGPSGSGKSVLAGVLAARLGAVILSTDMLRRELFSGESSGREELDRGRYASEARERVYGEIERQAEAFLRQERPVVVDGTYIERRQRLPIEEVVGRNQSHLLLVECTAPDEVVRVRQQKRQGEAWTTSEGSWEVYLAQKQRLELAEELPESNRVAVDTTKPLAQQIEAVLGKLEQLGK